MAKVVVQHIRPTGEIRGDSLYSLDEVSERLKLGTHAQRTARRKGLRVYRIGTRGFIFGGDLIEWVRANG